MSFFQFGPAEPPSMHGSDYFVGLTPTLLCGTTADAVGQGFCPLSADKEMESAMTL
jgi:hypothetical protein